MYDGSHQSSEYPVCDYEGSEYQREFWDKGGREYEDLVERIALRRLLPKTGRLFLEIGSGAGRLTPEFDRFERVVLLDYSLTQLQQAQERLGQSARLVFVAADIYRLPFVPGLFDGAVMVRAIHHLVDVPSALAGIRAVLKPSGTLVLEYANKQNAKAILRYWLRRQEWSPFTREQIEFTKLNFNMHPQTIRECLSKAGLRVRQQRTVSHFRLELLKRIVPTALLAAADAALQFTGNYCQITPSVFLRADADSRGRAAAPDQFFRCLHCKHNELTNRYDHLACQECGRLWMIRDGIYDFRGPVARLEETT